VAWTTIAAIYFITWWVVLFAILPWGVKSQSEHGEDIPPGTDPGAPVLPRLGMKIIWTTIVATALFVSVYYVFANRWITIEDMASWVGMPK
jgi:predicted secreted protein